MYKCTNLTQVLVSLSTKKDMVQFLSDRERSVRAKLRENPSPALTGELKLIKSLQKELNSTSAGNV